MLPTDGYNCEQVLYRVRYEDAVAMDALRINIWLGDERVITREQADTMLRPLMEQLRNEVEAGAMYPGQIKLLVSYQGSKDDDLTPPPQGGEG